MPQRALPPFVTALPGGCALRVRVVPRAGRSGVGGARGGALLVRLAAAPVEGRANAELVAVLAAALRVPKRALTIVAGERGREKRIEVEGLDAGVAAERLDAGCGGAVLPSA